MLLPWLYEVPLRYEIREEVALAVLATLFSPIKWRKCVGSLTVLPTRSRLLRHKYYAIQMADLLQL
jgi:hypothetical protein